MLWPLVPCSGNVFDVAVGVVVVLVVVVSFAAGGSGIGQAGQRRGPGGGRPGKGWLRSRLRRRQVSA